MPPMGIPAADRKPTTAYCWNCDYPLTQLQSSACPECGRPFDPAPPAPPRQPRPLGRLRRWMAAGSGRLTLALAILGAALVLANTRWPATTGHWGFFDIPYFFGPT